MNVLFVLSLLCFVSLSTQVTMAVYDRPGFYELTPFDYGYQDSIIVELWSAGSGSTTTYYKNGTVLYCPGNSGAYVKFKLETQMRTFYFGLGSGGICTTTPSPHGNENGNEDFDEVLIENYIGGNGGDSVFYDQNQLPVFNLEGAHSYVPMEDYIYIYYVDLYEYYTEHYNKMAYHSGITDPCYYSLPDGPNKKCGSHAPYGYECISNLECSGYFGSGAGYNCNILAPGRQYYHGGDGTLILYY